jgi:hypothetical protein
MFRLDRSKEGEMTKKSAVTIAGGIAAALVAGLVAVSINMGILRAAGAPAGPGKLSSSPIVRTEIRTIHHTSKPKGEGQATKTVVIPRPPSIGSAVGTSPSSHQSEAEHDFGENDDD